MSSAETSRQGGAAVAQGTVGRRTRTARRDGIVGCSIGHTATRPPGVALPTLNGTGHADNGEEAVAGVVPVAVKVDRLGRWRAYWVPLHPSACRVPLLPDVLLAELLQIWR